MYSEPILFLSITQMEPTSVFVKSLLTTKIKVKPHLLGKNIDSVITKRLQSKLEGICSQYGYIRPQSIDLYKYSMGLIQPLSLNGDVEYIVQFHADVCNPSKGSIIKGKVMNINRFGFLIHAFTESDKTIDKTVSFLEIIVAKTLMSGSDVDIDIIDIGDTVYVELMDRKFELNHRKISGVGKIINYSNVNVKERSIKLLSEDIADKLELDESEAEEDEVEEDEEEEDAREEEEDVEEVDSKNDPEQEGESDALSEVISDFDDYDDDDNKSDDGFFSDESEVAQ